MDSLFYIGKGQKGNTLMKRELVESYFDWNEIRLEAYLRIDPELIELERECEATMDELKPYIEKYGHEFWTIIDRQ